MRVKHLPRECKIEESKVGIMLLLCSTLGIHLIEKLVARVYFPFFRIQECNFDSRLDGGQQLKVSAIATPSFCIFTRGMGHKTELPL